MATAADRRKSPRVPALLPVRTSNHASREVFGVTRDVSAGGVYIYTDLDKWSRGSRIDFVFDFPQEVVFGLPTALCRGTVVRAEQAQSVYGLAVRLDRVSVLDS